jgi:DNA replication protein DnaD
MILEANHADGTVNIGMQLIECKRGQSIRSLQGWSKRWGVSKSTVRSFFDLLKNDSMLRTENITVTTRITILNYDDYQTLPHATQTQRKRKPNATQTQADPNNNDNNDNNNIYIYADEKLTSREDIFKKSIEPYLQKYGREMCNDFYMYWTEPNKSKTKLRFEMQKTWDVGRRLVTWSKNNQKYKKPISATQKVSETEYKEF